MSLKILGGVAKGHSLLVPKGDLIRPTSVMLRRRLFDAHQFWQGKVFIDLCAGTGAMGLEAWSRGADEVYLIEANRKVYSLMCENIKSFKNKFDDEREVHAFSKQCQRWLIHFISIYKSWPNEKQLETVLFLDPPYPEKSIYQKIVQEILQSEKWFLGELWIESDRQKGLAHEYWHEHGLNERKLFTQGTSYIAIFPFA